MPRTHSPLRYPGGKTQLAKYVKHLLDLNDTHETYIEPFAGGFGVALELLFSKSIDQVVLNDYDPSIFAIWNSIINKHEEFIDLINNTPVTIEEWQNQHSIYLRTHNDPTSLENGFATFFLNRTNRSGIINARPIGGLKQDGKYKLDCRYNKNDLLKKLEKIHKFKDSIHIYNLDANEFISGNLQNYDSNKSFTFFDPPYFKQGQNLYLSFVNKNDHKKLANNIIKNCKSYKWITTYDLEEDIYSLYAPYVQSFEYHLNYSANTKRKAKEYLFANNNTMIESFENINVTKL